MHGDGTMMDLAVDLDVGIDNIDSWCGIDGAWTDHTNRISTAGCQYRIGVKMSDPDEF